MIHMIDMRPRHTTVGHNFGANFRHSVGFFSTSGTIHHRSFRRCRAAVYEQLTVLAPLCLPHWKLTASAHLLLHWRIGSLRTGTCSKLGQDTFALGLGHLLRIL